MAHQHQPTIPTRPKDVFNICRCDRKITWDGSRWVVPVPAKVEPGSLGDRLLDAFFGPEVAVTLTPVERGFYRDEHVDDDEDGEEIVIPGYDVLFCDLTVDGRTFPRGVLIDMGESEPLWWTFSDVLPSDLTEQQTKAVFALLVPTIREWDATAPTKDRRMN